MSHIGLTQDPAKSVRPPSTPERLGLLEERCSHLENTVMSAIRDLAMNVNQMHRTQLEALKHGVHHDHSHAPVQPSIVFTFLEAASLNSMYRVYLDAADHPICPNKFNIHTRSDDGVVFDALPVEPALDQLMMDAFATQVGNVPNKVYFVEVHRLSDERIDESSVPVGGTSE